ncbi:Panacea domain-containing protein [Oceaniovalibus sp. ACAM 378]|uniref:Panacea domain-containing protein n=1 Tax=Oceaniovalibus sp. ACAM 378 TaxID=2599923 RepID=UPI00165202CF|nr:Panacea domain-containing protein [Oceaniovalibus sp. ACAM 378]
MNDAAPRIVTMKPNVPRILASLYHVMTEAVARKRKVSQYDLVKTLFLADRAHLNEWGRPITYDNYTAMLHGPVPSLAYDLLKANMKSLHDCGIEALPWRVVDQTRTVKHYFPLNGAFDVDQYLSESDIEALNDALGMVLRLGFGQIRKLTHEDQAYVDAWREDGGSAAYDMKLGLLFDEPNFDQAAMLAEYSPYV